MKLKIVNVKKFITSTLIVLGIIALVYTIFSNKSFSKTEVKFKTETIVSGDTIWEIAKNEKNYNEYYKNKDIRYIVYDIQNANNISNTNLNEGDIILIPTY
jgi:hypothetical protein